MNFLLDYVLDTIKAVGVGLRLVIALPMAFYLISMHPMFVAIGFCFGVVPGLFQAAQSDPASAARHAAIWVMGISAYSVPYARVSKWFWDSWLTRDL